MNCPDPDDPPFLRAPWKSLQGLLCLKVISTIVHKLFFPFTFPFLSFQCLVLYHILKFLAAVISIGRYES
uniref:Uncharacterized protein n=1 Tax=Populus trichocarpa TaxID=3694 RepID=A0A2K2B0E2_POPTR